MGFWGFGVLGFWVFSALFPWQMNDQKSPPFFPEKGRIFHFPPGRRADFTEGQIMHGSVSHLELVSENLCWCSNSKVSLSNCIHSDNQFYGVICICWHHFGLQLSGEHPPQAFLENMKIPKNVLKARLFLNFGQGLAFLSMVEWKWKVIETGLGLMAL